MTQVLAEQRFSALFHRCQRPLMAYALRRLTPEDAADVVAETFTVAWRRLDDVPRGDDELLWLYVTARWVIANLDRGARRRSHLVERLGRELPRAVAVPGANAANEDAMVAARVLAELDDRDRDVLLLSAWEGLSSAQLAVVLGCSPTAARIRLSRARARLRAGLAKEAGRGTLLPGSSGLEQAEKASRSQFKEVERHEGNAAVARP